MPDHVQGDAGHRREQDELLAQRVERPDVEVQGGDDVGGAAQLGLNAVEQQAVDAVVVAEGRKAVSADEQHDSEAGTTRA